MKTLHQLGEEPKVWKEYVICWECNIDHNDFNGIDKRLSEWVIVNVIWKISDSILKIVVYGKKWKPHEYKQWIEVFQRCVTTKKEASKKTNK